MTSDLAPDWILQQTLAVQRNAHQTFVNTKPELDDGGLTLTVLGCGTMGTAILSGIMDSMAHPDQSSPEESKVPLPQRIPSKFNACVRSHESAQRVKKELGKYNARLTVYESEILEPLKQADIILLCCKPQTVRELLRTEGVRDALAGKLLVSISAGVTERHIHDTLYRDALNGFGKCTIVRAMPNAAAAIRESMTVIATSNPPLPEETDRLLTWMFTRIGRVIRLPPSAIDACTALCGSGPAFAALLIESMAAGAIARGVPQEAAYTMAAQTVRGTTGLLLQGEHPAVLRDKITTPGGCTSGGLAVLEENGVRGAVAKAVRESTVLATKSGEGR